MTITELEQAVTQLSEEDFARFREWFEEYEAQLLDEQIERDAMSGKPTRLPSKPSTIIARAKPKSYEASRQPVIIE
jgi:hypothetical protein